MTTTLTSLDLISPGDGAYDAARLAWNLTVDQRPAGIVLPRDARDVQEAVALAHARGMEVAVQSTGHGAAALAPLDDALLIKTERMRGVSIDPAARTARVEAG